MSEVINLFVWLIKEAWKEIRDIPNSKQSLPLKMNAIFAVIVAVVIVILCTPSLLKELADFFKSLLGKEVQSTTPWETIVGIISLVVYAILCVSLSAVLSRPPAGSSHKRA